MLIGEMIENYMRSSPFFLSLSLSLLTLESRKSPYQLHLNIITRFHKLVPMSVVTKWEINNANQENYFLAQIHSENKLSKPGNFERVLFTPPSPKFFYSQCRKSALFKTLIGCKSTILRCWLVEVRNYGFGLPGQSFPAHVDSDKLRNELHS